MAVRSITILIHERHTDAQRRAYRLWAIVANWRRRGLRVGVQFGLQEPMEADLLFPHIDVSYIPGDYWGYIQGHPLAVNRSVRDIRKTVYCDHRLTRGDDWDGPVIVKTRANCGGFGDDELAHRGRRSLTARAWSRISRRPRLERLGLAWVRSLRAYHVYPSPRYVPGGAFHNPHLVVERFLPERRGTDYAVRMWTVFGDRWIHRTLIGPDPLVKNRNARLTHDTDPPPAEIVAWRSRLGLDYGKMDYVIHDGRAILLDVNTTPTVTGSVRTDEHTRAAAPLADGLASFSLPSR
ncbi:MAG: hypothetical protein IT437_00480 [Phycisphaerales bacterium]|nr:hypothetical protein [Phycisphaerales bacterium]